jgi:hypothetical protein
MIVRKKPLIKPAVWPLLCWIEKNEKEQGRFSNKTLVEGVANFAVYPRIKGGVEGNVTVSFDPADCKTALDEAFKLDLVFPGGILSPQANELLFPAKVFGEASSSRRTGGELHTRLLREAAREFRSVGWYTEFDTGEETHAQAPDILVTPLLTDENGRASATLWDIDHQFAVEAEVEPKRRPERVRANFVKNRDGGLPTYFITGGESADDYDNMFRIDELVAEVGGCTNAHYIYPGLFFIKSLYDPNRLAGVMRLLWSDEGREKNKQLEQYNLFKSDGWYLYSHTVSGHKYLYARKNVGGRRIYRSLGPLTPEIETFLGSDNEGGKRGGKGCVKSPP